MAKPARYGPAARPVLALVGPTGSGKSEVALAVAERLGAEIVAVDAFTVYRGMDISTAKPDAAARRRVPHHMVDVLDPSEDCTVQWFQAEARARIAEVRARGRTALLVGGSGLYFRAVVDPLEFPPTDPEVRARLRARYRNDPEAAHARLRAADPDAAAKIDPENLRRSVRALEVLELTGRPFSAWRTAWERYESIYPSLRVVGVGVPRGELNRRLGERLERMLAAGWLEECRRLAAHPAGLSATARQAIGYAELFDHLEGRLDAAEARDRIRVRTRRYAARQVRWFARDPRVEWVAASEARTALVGEEAPRPPAATT